jgi:hypothetical protein
MADGMIDATHVPRGVLMTANDRPWFAVGPPGAPTRLRCGSCGREIDLGFWSVDHHPSVCPACGVESVFLSWRDRLVQILPGPAPPEIVRLLRWAQANLDELEFVSVLASLAELADAVHATAPKEESPSRSWSE